MLNIQWLQELIINVVYGWDSIGCIYWAEHDEIIEERIIQKGW